MTEHDFEQLVAEGIEAIPEAFLAKLNNVAITIADEPTRVQRQTMRLGRGHTLLGLYEGIPQTKREHYGVGGPLPDKITIFRRPIEDVAGGNPAEIRAIVRDTVWHEIAHHFGMDERAVRDSEAKRRRSRAA